MFPLPPFPHKMQTLPGLCTNMREAGVHDHQPHCDTLCVYLWSGYLDDGQGHPRVLHVRLTCHVQGLGGQEVGGVCRQPEGTVTRVTEDESTMRLFNWEQSRVQAYMYVCA